MPFLPVTCIMQSEGPENSLSKFISILDESGYRGEIKIAYDEWNLRSWHHPGFPRMTVQNYSDPDVQRIGQQLTGFYQGRTMSAKWPLPGNREASIKAISFKPEGIDLGDDGEPVAYHVLKHHPGGGQYARVLGQAITVDIFKVGDHVDIIGTSKGKGFAGVIKRHGFTPEEHEVHIDDLLHRFSNIALGDTVARVGKDPIRKLGPNDRLIGGAKVALEYGITPRNVSSGIAAALMFAVPEVPAAMEIQRTISEKGVDFVLESISKVSPGSILSTLIHEQLDIFNSGQWPE